MAKRKAPLQLDVDKDYWWLEKSSMLMPLGTRRHSSEALLNRQWRYGSILEVEVLK